MPGDVTVRSLGPLPRWPSAAVSFRRVQKQDLGACAELEAASYPADEAASPENLALRQQVANDFFWGAFEKSDGSLIGFVCGTCAKGTSLTHESMEKHVPGGELLCVHSVVVNAKFRRRGVAEAMLREYLKAVASLKPAATGPAPPRACALIAKAGLVSLYMKAGFELMGLSPVVHGADPWFELQVQDIARVASGEPMLQCDAFATTPCTGNSAAVVFSHRGGDAEWMQKVAAENNLAETAFVEPLPGSEEPEEPSRYALRWFTPTCEVDLCGHATLGAAHALWSSGRTKRRRIDFESRKSGVLSCRRTDAGWIEMDFPADPPTFPPNCACPGAEALAKALGLGGADGVLAVGRGRFDILCEVTPAAFDQIKADQNALMEFDCRGVVATTKGCQGSADAKRAALMAPENGKDLGIDFRSRFFGPRAGIPEDPVTGSAHCMLAPYWKEKLGRSGETAEVIGFQASQRGGVVKCLVQSSAGRVRISGPAVTTLEGTLYCG